MQVSPNSTDGARLTPETIAAHALALADEDGLEKLTVRRLASRIGIGTMTFYGYFRSKEEILDAMADLALGSLVLPDRGANETPSEAIVSMARAFRQLLDDHPAVAQILVTRVTESPQARRGAMEAVIDRLIASGIPGPLAVQCYGFIIIYTLGFQSYQTPRNWAGDDAESDERRRQQSHRFAALPMDEFPRLIALRDSIIELPADSQFEFGLQCLCTQVEARLNG